MRFTAILFFVHPSPSTVCLVTDELIKCKSHNTQTVFLAPRWSKFEAHGATLGNNVPWLRFISWTATIARILLYSIALRLGLSCLRRPWLWAHAVIWCYKMCYECSTCCDLVPPCCATTLAHAEMWCYNENILLHWHLPNIEMAQLAVFFFILVLM